MRAKDRGISDAYFEAVAPTYDEAKTEALKGIRLSEREVRFNEGGCGPEGMAVRAVSFRTRLQEATSDLEIFIKGMDVDAKISAREEAGLIFLSIDGDALGFLIGRGGSSLESIEYLLNIIHNRRFTPHRHIIIDIGNYRSRQLEFIDGLLLRAVQHIANRGTPYEFRPMSPKERKLTHLLLKKYPGHVSISVGEDEDRRVEIHPVKEELIEESETFLEDEPDDTEPDTPPEDYPDKWGMDGEGSPLD